MTAPVIRYVVSIQEDVLYDILKSLISSGMAGTNIVSAYKTIVATELSTITILHEEAGIFFPEGAECDCKIIFITISLLFYLYILDSKYLRIVSHPNNLIECFLRFVKYYKYEIG